MASSSHSSAHTILTASPYSSTLSLSANSSIPSITPRPTPSLSHPNKTPSSISLFSDKWSTKVSFFPTFFTKIRDSKPIKEELLQAIEPLDRGADASPEDQQRIDEIARKLEAVNPTKELLKSDLLNGKWELIYTTSSSIMQTQKKNLKHSTSSREIFHGDTGLLENLGDGLKRRIADHPQYTSTKEPLKSDFLNGKWELIYTTSRSILQTQRPKFLRSRTNFQAINADILRTRILVILQPDNCGFNTLNTRKVAVKFDFFQNCRPGGVPIQQLAAVVLACRPVVALLPGPGAPHQN